MRVRILAQTTFHGDVATELTEGVWEPDIVGTDAANLAEFAGRVCYGSFNKPNPATASNAGYLEHILEVKHTTLVEHGTVSIYVDGVSRSFTHELIRHRHNSYSQLSQRFVIQGRPREGVDPFVTPPLFRDDPVVARVLQRAWMDAMDHYDLLVSLALEKVPGTPDLNPTDRKKRAREAARCVLPNMTPTAIVVTGNHSAWRDFFAKRGSLQADAEIREFAIAAYHLIKAEEPHIYHDFHLMVAPDDMRYLVREEDN